MASLLHGNPSGVEAGQPARPISLYDYQDAARERLPQMVYDYFAGGAHDEITLRDNRAAFERLRLRYRVLTDVSERDLRAKVLGFDLAFPAYVAPTAFHQLAHSDGELASVRAAGAAGTAFMLSTFSTVSIEEVTAAASGPVWFQLYVYRDREVTRSLVERAEAAGCSALVLTVDAQFWGIRERDVRNGFGLPERFTMKNLAGTIQGEMPEVPGDSLAAYVDTLLDPSLNWMDLDWLCGLTKLPVVVKGIVRGDDARRAADHGAAGVVVSNHGGRQLDSAPATITVLPEIADAVGGRLEILLDGGVRRGTDVLKALALGASAVGMGRPVLWGLAIGGEAGVRHVLDLLRDEFDLAMALCGCTAVSRVERDLVGF